MAGTRAGRRSSRTIAALIGVVSLVVGSLGASANPIRSEPLDTSYRSATDGEPISVGRLKLGRPIFWTGPVVTAGLASDGSAPGIASLGGIRCRKGSIPESPVTVDCITYEIDVPAGGDRLRVAIDHPSHFDGFGLQLFDPDGEVVDESSGEPLPAIPASANGWSASFELFASEPQAGIWRIVVIPHDVNRSQFRMRALLERAPSPAPAKHVPLLPDLRPAPPFDIGFGECQLSEVVQYGASRCLRLSQGPENISRGKLEIFTEELGGLGSDSNGQTTLVGPAYQRVTFADGDTEVFPAGQFEYHVAHGHYHHAFTGGYELFRVDPARGTMTKVGAAPKQGFCMADFVLAEWRHFTADRAREGDDYLEPRNCLTPGSQNMSLSAGWGDTYAHTYEGQYVEFGDNPDGHYVVTARTNLHRHVREADYRNNVSYAYIQVCGNSVDVIERGRGEGPFDPGRTIVNDGRRAGLSDPKTYEPVSRRCT